MYLNKRFLLLVAAFSAFNIVHAAQDYKTETNTQTKAVYHETKGGDWFTRLRALYILPFSSSSSVNTLPNSGVTVHSGWTGEFDIGYMFTPNLGSELILATSYHTLWGKKSLEGTKIGSTWVLPPTLTVQVRFFPTHFLQPYVGGGLNYTVFYSKQCDLPNTSLHLSPSWGGAIQGGVYYFFFRDWLINLDVKYVWINTEAHLNGSVNGKVHVNINPLLVGFGFGRKW